MTLKQLIARKALELMQLLEYCDDGDFIDSIVAAVDSCDYAAPDVLEEDSDATD